MWSHGDIFNVVQHKKSLMLRGGDQQRAIAHYRAGLSLAAAARLERLGLRPCAVQSHL
jgi:hypothetical protein